MTHYYRGNHFKKKKTKVFILVNFVSLLVIIFLAILGIIQTNRIAEYSFTLKNLQAQFNQIEATNQLMEIKTNHFQSMSNLGLLADKESMVKITKMDYIVPVESAVAVR